jgi:hypothetical protein
MTTKSPERTEFLSDVLITAVEGGINYWAQVTAYDPDDGRAVVLDEDGDEFVVDGDKLATALGRIRRGEVKYLDASVARFITEASRENEAGDIDAGLADAIFQVAALGELVYA